MKTNSPAGRVVVAFLPALIIVLSSTSAHAGAVLTSYSYSWSKEFSQQYIDTSCGCEGPLVTFQSMQSLNYSWSLTNGASYAGQYISTNTVEGLTCPTVEQNSSATEWQAWQGQGIAVVAGSKTTCDPNDEPVEPYQHTNTVGAFNQYLRWEWRNTSNTNGSEIIITSGSPKVGIAPVGSNTNRQSLWWISVSATDLLTGQPVPYSAITIAGKTPDAQGSVFVKLNDGQWNDVTPNFGTLTSGQHHISASVGATRMPLELKTVELVWFDEEQEWDWVGATINDTTRTNWVGEQVWTWMELANESELDSAGYTVTSSHAWTVAPWPKTFGDYIHNAPSNQLTKPFALTNSSVNFFWLDESQSETLAASMSVNIGTSAFTLNAETKFEVKRPDVQMTATSGEIVEVNVGQQLVSCGRYTSTGSLSNLIQGITFQASTNGPGEFVFVQIVDLSLTRFAGQNQGTNWSISYFNTGLDVVWPYGQETNSTGIATSDSPYSHYNSESGWSEFSRSGTYRMWLMFMPTSGSGSSWVPLKSVTWNWSADAVPGQSDPTLTSSNPPQSASGTDTYDHPVWSRVAYPGNFIILP